MMTENGAEATGGNPGERVTLAVTGIATVQAAAELRGRLAAALEKSPRVTLDVGGITRLDSSFFQLICAARRSALAVGGDISLSGCNSEEFLRKARATGFRLDESGCPGGSPVLQGD